MDVSVIQTYLGDVLHAISQGLLIPTILLLICLIGYAAFCIGSIIAEYFTERKHFKVTMPKFLSALMSAKQDEIPAVIQESGLLNRQKIALLTVYDYRTLPGDAMVALIRRLVSEEEARYDRIAARNNMAARVSPMIGLMGTLIPLGPGIQALGKADTNALSSSLLIAFDTTVAGLVVAAVCLVIGKIRQTWYGDYMTALDSGMATMLEKIETMRSKGLITIEEPTDYAFLFEKSLEKEKPAAKDMAKAAEEVKAEAENGAVANAVADAEVAEAAGVAAAAPAVGAASSWAADSKIESPFAPISESLATPVADEPAPFAAQAVTEVLDTPVAVEPEPAAPASAASTDASAYDLASSFFSSRAASAGRTSEPTPFNRPE